MNVFKHTSTNSPDVNTGATSMAGVLVDVSVIIVNYNSGDLLRRTLQSLRDNVTLPFEVIVVDKDSVDDSLENLVSLQHTQIVRTGQNLGFAKACNVGSALARGQILHFLNPDTQVTENIN